MNVRMLAPANVAAAAVLIGGALVVALPGHATSIVRLVVLTTAAAVVVHAVASVVPEWTATGWSPFGRAARREGETSASGEIDRIRSRLSGRRQRIGDGPPLPPETVRLLQPLIRVALEREGLGCGKLARTSLSPLTLAVLAADPLQRPNWFRTHRPDGRQVAEIVHGVLDDLDRLSGAQGASRHADPPSPLDASQERAT